MEKSYKYEVIAEKIRDEILSGKLQSGAKIPTESELIKQYKMSRQTIRKAIECLEQEGILVRRQGSGTYVEFHQTNRPVKNTIGIIALSVTDYIFPRIIEAMEIELFRQHYKMNLSVTQNRFDYEREILLRYISEPVDGLLVDGTLSGLPNPNAYLYKKLQSMGVPIVMYNRPVDGVSAPLVTMDYYHGGYTATKYLIDKGHRNIAIVFRCDELQGRQQFKGYCDALMECDLPIRNEGIVPFTSLQWGSDSIEFFLKNTIERLRNCTAIVCFNENVAIRLMNQIHSAGMRVPDDFSVVGFDGCFDSDIMSVPLTTFVLDAKMIGKLSVEKIINMIAGRTEKSFEIPWRCIERNSVRQL